jgi:hypothetical protein
VVGSRTVKAVLRSIAQGACLATIIVSGMSLVVGGIVIAHITRTLTLCSPLASQLRDDRGFLKGAQRSARSNRCTRWRPQGRAGAARRAQRAHRHCRHRLAAPLAGEGWGGLRVSGRDWPKRVAVKNALIRKPPADGPSIMSLFKEREELLAWIPIGSFGGGSIPGATMLAE